MFDTVMQLIHIHACTVTACTYACMVLTCIVVVIPQTPPDQSPHLKYIEWVEYFLYEQHVVGLHWDVYRVGTVSQQSIVHMHACGGIHGKETK